MANTPPKIYAAGHRGMVGSAIVRQLTQQAMDCRASLAMTPPRSVIASAARQSMPLPAPSIITRTHAELDLTNQAAVA